METLDAVKVAESLGFEPKHPFGMPVFKTGAIAVLPTLHIFCAESKGLEPLTLCRAPDFQSGS